MSAIWDIPENLQVPADYKSPPNFNHVALFDRLFLGNASESNTDSERLAILLASNAISFLISPQPPPGRDYAALRETPMHIRTFTWPRRTEAFLDYLNPYVTEVRNRGAPEQQQFIRELLDMKLYDYMKSKSLIGDDAPQIITEDTDEDNDDEYQDETFPEPTEAIIILDRIAQGCASTSVEYVALQIAVRALRNIIESGEAAEFVRYVEQTARSREPHALRSSRLGNPLQRPLRGPRVRRHGNRRSPSTYPWTSFGRTTTNGVSPTMKPVFTSI